MSFTSTSTRYILSAVLCAAAALIYRQVSQPAAAAAPQASNADAETVRRMLLEAIARDTSLCVATGPFPFEVGEGHCERCDELMQAGLLLRDTVSQRIANAAVAEGEEAPTTTVTRYLVSDAGAALYRAKGDARLPSQFESSGFCFGSLSLHAIDEVLPPTKINGDRMIGFTYRLKVNDPHPVLLDARAAKALRLPALSSSDAVLPPAISTLVMSKDGSDMHLDDRIRYGKYVGE